MATSPAYPTNPAAAGPAGAPGSRHPRWWQRRAIRAAAPVTLLALSGLVILALPNLKLNLYHADEIARVAIDAGGSISACHGSCREGEVDLLPDELGRGFDVMLEDGGYLSYMDKMYLDGLVGYSLKADLIHPGFGFLVPDHHDNLRDGDRHADCHQGDGRPGEAGGTADVLELHVGRPGQRLVGGDRQLGLLVGVVRQGEDRLGVDRAVVLRIGRPVGRCRGTVPAA